MDKTRPEYYKAEGPYECYKVINHWNLNFNLGSVLKYIKRAGLKKSETVLDDLLKARQYIDFEIERVKDLQMKESPSYVEGYVGYHMHDSENLKDK